MRFAKIWIPFVFLLLTSLLTGCCTQTITHPTVPQIAQAANNDTVALMADFNKKPFCTGVWVSDSVILTANHCVEGYAEMLHRVAVVKALVADGCPEFLAEVLSSVPLDALKEAAEDDPMVLHVLEVIMTVPPVNPDNLSIPYTTQDKVIDNGVQPRALFHSIAYVRAPKEDLALLRIDRTEAVSEHGTIVLADKSPVVGDHVYSTGQTMGGFYSFKDGLVSAYRHSMKHDGGVEFDGPFMQTTIPMAPGDSGCGVFDSDGHFVGLGSFVEPRAHFAFTIHLETVRGFLQGQHLAPVHLDPMAPDPELNK
jgi:hypothetical protein